MITWRREPFDAVIDDVSAGNAKVPQSEFLRDGRYAIVDQGKELVAGYTDDAWRVCGAELPVIVFGDHTRTIKYVDFPFCMGADGVKVLRPKVDADVKYLYYYLRQLRIAEAGYDRHFKYLKRSTILLPPLGEQRRIAEILDKADALRAKRRAALAQLDSLAESIFLDMFGPGGRYARNSLLAPLSDVCRTITDGVHKTPTYIDSGIPFVTVKNIVSGVLDLSETKKITPKDHETFTKRTKPEKGDVLVSKDGTIGIPCPVETETDFSIFVSVALLKPKADVIDQSFLIAQFRSDWIQRQIRASSKGIAIRHLHLEDFRRLKVIVPPMSLQCEFATQVRELGWNKALQITSLQGHESLFASLQHRAFRGEL